MIYLVCCGVAFGASLLTLFSGFGLGTLLLPAFALFFPVSIAVAATAVVHLCNNAFKFLLLYRDADWPVVKAFGGPALAAAFGGAALLGTLAAVDTGWRWQAAGLSGEVTAVKLVIGVLVLVFALLELRPGGLKSAALPLWMGGLLSGFFGGLSGHQGALRAAFLRPYGLEPAAFAATQCVIACGVDVVRIAVYGSALSLTQHDLLAASGGGPLIVAATVAAFAGAWLGKRMLHKVTLVHVQRITGGLLLMVGTGLVLGLV